jgi:hypothetical protein
VEARAVGLDHEARGREVEVDLEPLDVVVHPRAREAVGAAELEERDRG